MKKVLIVVLGNGEKVQEVWRRKLEGKVKCINTNSVKDTIMRFSANLDVDAIAVDSCSDDITTTWSLLALVRTLRSSFGGPIIPISALGCWRQNLLNAGCNDYDCSVTDFPQRILEILDVQE